MELARRDRRHLKGQAPRSDAPRPPVVAHAVDAGWSDTQATLWMRAPGGRRTFRLPFVADRRIDLEVLPERHCVGPGGPGGGTPCPRAAAVDASGQCYLCVPAEERRCMFGASEQPCAHAGCAASHFVYVAFYGPLPKVGLSSAARGDGRLVEQGADAYFVAAHAETRAAARRTEARLSSLLDLPEVRRSAEILPWTARAVPWDAIERRYFGLAEQIRSTLGTPVGPLRRVHADGAFPLPQVPVVAGTVGHHHGTIVAAKGRFVFYRDDTSTTLWALPIGAVVAHDVRYQAADVHTEDDAPTAVPHAGPHAPPDPLTRCENRAPRNGHI